MEFKIIISSEAKYSLNKIKNYVQSVWGDDILIALMQKLDNLMMSILFDPFTYPLIRQEIRRAILTKHYSLIFAIKNYEITIVFF